MTNYAYLRVSTDKQDVDNQRHGLLEYANSHKLVPLDFREDTSSGKIKWRERGIGKILQEAKAGDVILAAEVSRLARSTLQVLEILEFAAEKKIGVHIVKNRLVMDGSLPSRITATVLGLAAEIEREFISARTTEALARQGRRETTRPSHGLQIQEGEARRPQGDDPGLPQERGEQALHRQDHRALALHLV
jgi:DNA invertase Pin-like site-specific DNA recombinase